VHALHSCVAVAPDRLIGRCRSAENRVSPLISLSTLMPRAAFTVGASDPQTVEVELAWWGMEEYYLNGTLFLRQWKLTGTGEREFNVGPHVVRIAVSARGNEYFARVFLDGQPYIEELFPELRALVESSSRPSSYLMPALGGAIAAVLVALWQSGIFTK
jgi:hypothetical protein